MQRLKVHILLLIAVLAGLTACDESVDPFLESDRNYTLFGTLDLARDTQYVRVIPIRNTLLPDSTAALGVRFESINLQTGRRTLWRDSLVTFPSGSTGHVFYAPLRIRAGDTYRIEVSREGTNIVTSAETQVPDVPTAEVFDEVLTFRGAFGVESARQEVHWRNVQSEPFRIDQFYRFMPSPRGVFVDIRLPIEPDYDLNGELLEVHLNLQNDKRTLDTLISTNLTPLAGLAMQLTILDPAFRPPNGIFDPEVLVQPGTMSNVENGFGFVGSVGRFSVEWLLERESMQRLGYLTLEETYIKSAAPAVQILPFEWSAMPN